MPNQFFTSQVIRTVTSSTSFLCSSIMAFMITNSKNALGSPYKRIIFGLTISDILQSLGFILSPLAAPKDTPENFWARGNVSTCEATGFILTAGGTALPMYTFLLTFYFYMRVRKKMSPKDFSYKIERYCHVFIITWNLICSCIALFMDYYNPSRTGSFCTMKEYPLYCNSKPEEVGECQRGANGQKASFVLMGIPALISMLGMITTLIVLNVYVFEHERTYSMNKERREIGCCQMIMLQLRHLFCVCLPHRRTQGARNGQENLPPENPQAQQDIRNADLLQRSYARASLVQSSLYVIAFCFTYTFLIFDFLYVLISNKPNPEWTFIALSLTLPIGGLLNILVYTRPKVLKVKEKHPNFPKFVCLFLVIVSGGEAPDESAIQAALRSIMGDPDYGRRVLSTSDAREEEAQGQDDEELFSWDDDLGVISNIFNLYGSNSKDGSGFSYEVERESISDRLDSKLSLAESTTSKV
ncbi:hypothetical protein CTEN210_04580 [Chaetoceros tenuissimus]|uniref:Uncharacterized protein n=1 Tax=Chaetoceros tenuissimus TaxID=426638 RepID=A0AAD3CNU9_9STRA|nr:hypothetical protein CTEN210_04580 [Chaetoceros tenuissimus]